MTTAEKMSMVGTLLGETYRITRRLGAGGMGEVYLAEHQRLPRSFAIKVLRETVAAETEEYRRFRREAEVCSRLRHPNIVEVIDFNVTPEGKPYLVMEFLEGEDLSERIAREGRLSLAKTLDIVGQVSDALAMTHADGIVHRDLKPQNIFLSARPGGGEWVKLLDFGISKIQDSQSMLTGAGSLMGTPFYMSPEQAGGGSATVTSLTDIFALGVITYEALSGKLPFVGDTLPRIIYQICFEEPPPVTSKVAGLPPRLAAVIQRALAKDANHRFGTVTEFMDELRQAAGDSPDQYPALTSGTDVFASTAMASDTAADAATVASVQSTGVALDATVQPQQTTLSGAAAELGEPPAATMTTPRGSGLRRLVPLALGVLAIGGLIVYLVAGRAPEGNKASAPTPGASMRTEVEAKPPEPFTTMGASQTPNRVVIKLRRLPSGARCTLDGRAVAGNPLVIPFSEQPVALVCDATGHKTFSAAFLPTKDRSVTVVMPAIEPPRADGSAGMVSVPVIARPMARARRPPRRPRRRVTMRPPPRREGMVRPRGDEDALF